MAADASGAGSAACDIFREFVGVSRALWAAVRVPLFWASLVLVLYVQWSTSRVFPLGMASDDGLPPLTAALGSELAYGWVCGGLLRPSAVASSDSVTVVASATGEIFALALVAGQPCAKELVADARGQSLGLASHRAPRGLGLVSTDEALVTDAMRGLVFVRLGTAGARPERGLALGHHVLHASGLALLDGRRALVTDDSWKFPPSEWSLERLEGRAHGRVLSVALDSGASELLIGRDLHAPRGVALAHDGSFAVIAEAGRARLKRLELRGVDAGLWSTAIPRLPCALAAIAEDRRAHRVSASAAAFWAVCSHARDDWVEHWLRPSWLASKLVALLPLAVLDHLLPREPTRGLLHLSLASGPQAPWTLAWHPLAAPLADQASGLGTSADGQRVFLSTADSVVVLTVAV